jgi:hypothetical protein
MSQKTSFAVWRQQQGLSIREAGELLGLSDVQIILLSRGCDKNGNAVVPKRDTRLLMSAVANRVRLLPWELTREELAVLDARTRRRREGARRARVQEAA